jgi:formamidopyrimidine-DNA glycosylase
MPELPEVQTVVDTLRPSVVGMTINAVTLHRADILTPAGFDLATNLTGRVISDISRRGKKIVFALNDGNGFVIHLGMTGRISMDDPLLELPKHTHLVIDIAKKEMRFRDPRRFGGIWWLGTEQSGDERMGPEPLTMRSSDLSKQLAKTSRAIKSALMDQRVVAGLGNIYVDESLFAAGIHPLTQADRISSERVGRLTRAIKSTLKKALHHRGSTLRDYFDANGDSGGFQKLHAVYDRAGLPCRKCKSPIQRIVLGGRSTHFCARCQPVIRGMMATIGKPRRRKGAKTDAKRTLNGKR